MNTNLPALKIHPTENKAYPEANNLWKLMQRFVEKFSNPSIGFFHILRFGDY